MLKRCSVVMAMLKFHPQINANFGYCHFQLWYVWFLNDLTFKPIRLLQLRIVKCDIYHTMGSRTTDDCTSHVILLGTYGKKQKP